MLSSGSVFVEAVEGTDKQLLDVNKAQLKQGMGSSGDPLPPLKSYVRGDVGDYRQYKITKNPDANGRYDMDFTGYSLSTMQLGLEGLKVHISSMGPAQDWNMKLGGDIFGVYENSPMEEYRKRFLLPMLSRLIKEQTGAK